MGLHVGVDVDGILAVWWEEKAGKRCTVAPGAKEVLASLAARGDVRFSLISGRENLKKETFRWLRENDLLGFFQTVSLAEDNRKDKGRGCRHLGIDIMLEDSALVARDKLLPGCGAEVWIPGGTPLGRRVRLESERVRWLNSVFVVPGGWVLDWYHFRKLLLELLDKRTA